MGDTIKKLSLVSLITSYTVCSLLIVAYSLLFLKAICRTNLVVVQILCTVFLGALVSYAYLNQTIYTCAQQDLQVTCLPFGEKIAADQQTFESKSNGISTFCFNLLQNTGYWILAMHYWTLSIRLYFMCAKKEMENKMQTFLIVIYSVGFAYNIMVPVLAVIYYNKDIQYDIAEICSPLASFILLCDALRRMSALLENKAGFTLDRPIMFAHLVSLLCFLVTSFGVAFIQLFGMKQQLEINIAQTLSLGVSQMFLIIIFNSLVNQAVVYKLNSESNDTFYDVLQDDQTTDSFHSPVTICISEDELNSKADETFVYKEGASANSQEFEESVLSSLFKRPSKNKRKQNRTSKSGSSATLLDSSINSDGDFEASFNGQ